MSDHYHDPADIKRLKDMRALAPADYEAWVNFNRIIARADGAIPRKYRELIALGVAFTTQCAYCIDNHTRHARAHGASKQEIAETAFVAAAVKAGGTLAHSLLALRIFEEAGQAD